MNYNVITKMFSDGHCEDGDTCDGGGVAVLKRWQWFVGSGVNGVVVVLLRFVVLFGF